MKSRHLMEWSYPRGPDTSVPGAGYVRSGLDMSGERLDMSGQDRSTR
jgi:hypothetical protein